MFFGLGFWNKRVTFEVHQKTEDRWLLHMLCDREQEAIDEARLLLMNGKSRHVKVVRLRTLSNGAASETVVYEQEMRAPAEKPICVRTPVGELALCDKVDDLYTMEGRRTISQVMRDYLAKANVTATELLYGLSHIRKLQDAQGLANAALHRVAQAQAHASGCPAKQRMQMLDSLLQQVQQKARTFAAEKASYPAFNGSNLAAVSRAAIAKVGAKAGIEGHDYILTALLTVWLFDFRSLDAKADALSLLMAQHAADEGFDRLLDPILADALSIAEVVQELFAPQPNLGSALIDMAGVALCRKGADERLANPVMKRIALLIAQGRAPQTQATLADRLLREMNADKPLDARAPDQDPVLLERLIAAMKGEDGTILGGARVYTSIERRRLRQREALLRAQGLHHIADNLRGS
jgi:hypothetical protein